MNLPQAARQILASLELVSHGATQQWNPSGGRSAERDPRPQGESDPPHVRWRRRMTEQPLRMDEWVRLATAELDELVRGNRVSVVLRPEPVQERRRRMIVEGESFPLHAVARAFNCLVSEVLEVRKAATDPERDLAFGRPMGPERDREGDALRLRSEGVSLREVERRTGVSRSTLNRLERAA